MACCLTRLCVALIAVSFLTPIILRADPVISFVESFPME
jgi:hypothetical protein